MDLNVSAAQQALANPSSGLKDLIAHAPTETGDALASIAPGITTSANSTSSDPAVSSGSEKEWTVVGSDASKKRGAASERLQIVDEEKQFTFVFLSSRRWGEGLRADLSFPMMRSLRPTPDLSSFLLPLHLGMSSRLCARLGSSRKGLNSSLEKWGLIDKGFGYDVVAVFGSQSTGKSASLPTLISRLSWS
jgi:hypothetical protein